MLVPLRDVRARVLDGVRPLPPIAVPRDQALGLVLADPIVADEPVPPFANTAMDGYAVRAGDTAAAAPGSPVPLSVVDELPAGRAPSTPVGAGEAIRIMTGAPVPDGADAVVPVEETEAGGPDTVRVLAPAAPGAHVRAAGGDIAVGTTVFPPGTEVRPAHLGVLASLGAGSVVVHPRPRVGVLSTGDELVEAGPLAPGQIRDSNRPLLLALLGETGAEGIDFGIAIDDEHDITRRVLHVLETCDVLVTSGGVSVGDYDHVKVVLDRLARERDGSFEWCQVAIKPAKPFAFGAIEGVPVFGLPGNPVSSQVSFELFARPVLRRLAGHARLDRPVVRARAGAAFDRRPDGKLHLDRVRVDHDGDGFVVERSGPQASNVLSGLAGAEGLALVPDGTGLAAGDPVDVLLLTPVGAPFDP